MISFPRSVLIYLATFRPYNWALFVTFPWMCLGPLSLASKGRAYSAGLILNAALAVAGLYLILIATFMLNDFTDRRIDEVAHPERPIPSGKVEARHIASAAFLFYAVALAISLIINRWVLLVSAVILTISFVHFKYTKRLLHITGSSEVITPLTWASMPVYCFLAVDNYDWPTILTLAIFIYFADVAHDVMGGACDLEGDRAGNVTTFASVLGRVRVVYISLVMFVLSGAAGVSLYFLAPVGVVYLTGLLGLIFYILFAYFSTLKNSRGPEFMARAVRNHSLIGIYFVAGFSLIFLDTLLAVWT